MCKPTRICSLSISFFLMLHPHQSSLQATINTLLPLKTSITLGLQIILIFTFLMITNLLTGGHMLAQITPKIAINISKPKTLLMDTQIAAITINHRIHLIRRVCFFQIFPYRNMFILLSTLNIFTKLIRIKACLACKPPKVFTLAHTVPVVCGLGIRLLY